MASQTAHNEGMCRTWLLPSPLHQTRDMKTRVQLHKCISILSSLPFCGFWLRKRAKGPYGYFEIRPIANASSCASKPLHDPKPSCSIISPLACVGCEMRNASPLRGCRVGSAATLWHTIISTEAVISQWCHCAASHGMVMQMRTVSIITTLVSALSYLHHETLPPLFRWKPWSAMRRRDSIDDEPFSQAWAELLTANNSMWELLIYERASASILWRDHF